MNVETLSLKQLTNIQAAAEDQIMDLREKYRQQPSRMRKNLVQAQILNRESIIKRVKELITIKQKP